MDSAAIAFHFWSAADVRHSQIDQSAALFLLLLRIARDTGAHGEALLIIVVVLEHPEARCRCGPELIVEAHFPDDDGLPVVNETTLASARIA